MLINPNIPAARQRRLLATLAAALLLSLIAWPLSAGVLNTLQTAFWQPASLVGNTPFGNLDHHSTSGYSLDGFVRFLTQPGVITAALLSLWTGLASTALALLLSTWTLQVWFGSQERARDRLVFSKQSPQQPSIIRMASTWLTPILQSMTQLMVAFPHVAFSIGLALLIAPSGSLLRWLSPWLTGFERPPLWTTVQDSWGLSLILGLALKEAAFFTLTLLAISQQLPLREQRLASRALHYDFAAFWWKLAMPQLYRQARFPILIVLSFSIAVVEIALLLGPTTPPTLSVLIWQFFTDAEPTHQSIATAGAVLLALLVALSFALWWAGEWLIKQGLSGWAVNGRRYLSGLGARYTAQLVTGSMMSIIVLSFVTLLLFAGSWRWSFRTPLPESWQLSLIGKAIAQLQTPMLNTLVLALSTALMATLIVISLLELLQLSRRRWLDRLVTVLMMSPLLLPPLVFLIGVQLSLLRWEIDGQFSAVLLGHLLYALPYVYLVLKTPWQTYDAMTLLQARLLTRSPWQALWRVKIPQLLPSISYAIALAVSVSIAQYLTTLLLGAGRYPTITTEAVALGSGGDRRLMAILAMLQCAIPLLGFALASHLGRRTQSPTSASTVL